MVGSYARTVWYTQWYTLNITKVKYYNLAKYYNHQEHTNCYLGSHKNTMLEQN